MKNILEVFNKISFILSRPQKVLSIFVLLLTLIGSVLECLGVTVIIPVVNVILNPEKLVESKVINKIPMLRNAGYNGLVISIIIGVVVIYLIKNLFFIFLSWFRIKYACKIQREISVLMMESYMSRGYKFFLDNDFGELNRGVCGDTTQIYIVLNAGFRLVSDLLTIMLICIFMFITDWSLSLIVVCMSLVCVTLIYFVFRKMMYDAGEQIRDYSAVTSQATIQAFQGIKDVLILRKQRHFIDFYKDNFTMVQKAQAKNVVGQESPAYIIEGLCIAGIMVVVLVRLLSGQTDESFVAVLAAFAIGAFRILPSLGRISIAVNQIMVSVPSVYAVYDDISQAREYAKAHPEVRFLEVNNKKLLDRGETVKAEKKGKLPREGHKDDLFRESLRLDNVSFAYEENIGNIFENLNLSVEKGKSVAIIGPSGAGKSTLIDILLGLLVPTEGSITVDGKPIAFDPDLWSDIIGYVPQSVFLTDDSILKNVAFGENDEEIDVPRVWEALDRAELTEFIKTLPDGIDTCTGDRGVRLSGGQRQRIAIARALYHRPEILVLDEATSALDSDTESAVMSAIDSLQGQVTMIIVAHRLTTVRNCDVIYEVENRGLKIVDKTELFDEA